MQTAYPSFLTLPGVPLTVTVEYESVDFVYKGCLVLLGSFLHCVPADSIRLRRTTKRITERTAAKVYQPRWSQPASRFGNEIAELPSGSTFGCVAQMVRSEEQKRWAGSKTDLSTSLTPCFAYDPSSLDCLSPAAHLVDSPKLGPGNTNIQTFYPIVIVLANCTYQVMGR